LARPSAAFVLLAGIKRPTGSEPMMFERQLALVAAPGPLCG
jgi:hypothetical protein